MFSLKIYWVASYLGIALASTYNLDFRAFAFSGGEYSLTFPEGKSSRIAGKIEKDARRSFFPLSHPSHGDSGQNERKLARMPSAGETSDNLPQTVALSETSLASGVFLGRSLQYRSHSGKTEGQTDYLSVPWHLASKKIAWHHISQPTFCPQPQEQQEQWSQPPEVPEVSMKKRQISGLSLRERLGRVIQSLFHPPDGDRAIAKEVGVPLVEVRPSIVPKSVTVANNPQFLRVWHSPSPQFPEPVAVNEEEFNILINGQVAIALTNLPQAQLIASRLHQVLSSPNFDADRVKPTILGGYPAAMMGDRLLLVADESLSLAEDANKELMIINWVNRLRLALDAKPFRLAEAQQQMYRIQETSQEFYGIASWYGPYFHGRLTANGERYNQEAFTAAHPSLPFNTYLKVTNLKNQETAIVRINDRGPYIYPRTLDLSRGVARCLESKEAGVVPYRAIIMSEL